MNILVTGGAGYIGSHTLIELVNKGHSVVVVDNLMNSSDTALHRVEEITGAIIPFYDVDLCNKSALETVFQSNEFDAVIHFAGLKAVGESVQKPLLYYSNNLVSTLNLCELMRTYNIKKLVFSSSATVYGNPSELPLTEESTVGIGLTNPYGQTKYMIECMLRDMASADSSFNVTILRYFNPVGAHSSGMIGEDPNGIPNNLMPFISQVAVGKRDKLSVFGNDYETLDGTGVRDYIHVVDLAKGHVAAIESSSGGLHIYNLGTGKGTTVLELLRAFENASGVEIPYEIVPRRDGDVDACYADCSKALKELGWSAVLSISDMCKDAWHWQSHSPNGYQLD